MEIYDKKEITKQISSLKRKIVPTLFVDHRPEAIAQRKLINQMNSTSTSKVIQRVKDPALIGFWGSLTTKQKQDFLSDYEMTEEQMAEYLSDNNTKGNLDAALKRFQQKLYSTPIYTTKQHNLSISPFSDLLISQMEINPEIKEDGVNISMVMPPPIIVSDVEGGRITESPLPYGTKIGFIQIVKSDRVERGAKTRADKYIEKHPEEGSIGWTIDRQTDMSDDPMNPYYGMTNEDSPTDNVVLGTEKSSAILKDYPHFGSNKPFIWEPKFETSAIIKECPGYRDLIGRVLTTVKWEFKVERNESLQLSCTNFNFSELPQPSQAFKNAVTIWNEIYAMKIPKLK